MQWRNNVARNGNNVASAIGRGNPSILCFIYMGATSRRRAVKIILHRRHFYIDATLCRVYCGDIDFNNGSKFYV
jgi:hypothetical protein